MSVVPARQRAFFNVSKAAIVSAASVVALAAVQSAGAAIDFVGQLNPVPGNSAPISAGSVSGFDVSVQVFKSGVTDAGGQGGGITCTAVVRREGVADMNVAMVYTGDAGANDLYTATIPTASLAPGNHALTASCDDGSALENVGGATFISVTPSPTPPPGNVMVQLFEWKYSDVAQECTDLAGSGYTAVQVSSPSEHKSHLTVSGNPWWVRYQPVSYLLESRSGSMQDFADMVAACDAAGIDVIVDIVINHMANAGSGAFGLAGTFYFGGSYNFPGSHGPADFHYCGTDPGGPREHDLFNFNSRFELQNCELVGLADIDTGATAPRTRLVNYLQTLIDFGVDGFRVDAAKHISSMDIGAIMGALTGDPYVVQEVIDSATEQVRFYEYLVHGDVTEFDYGPVVGGAFSGCSGSPAGLANLTGGFGLYLSDNALVFTDNHDTQRGGGCRVTFESGPAYDLANVFMLAHPYGYPRVMSSYHFATESSGPPSSGGVTNSVWVDGEPAGCNGAEFVCEHRRPAMRNLARLRELAGSEPLTDWWDDGNQRIAFGRGDRGYVALNAASNTINRAWSTSMAPGTYCNVARYEVAGDPATCRYPGGEFPAPTSELVNVIAGGTIPEYALAGVSALAIHAQAQVVVANSDGDSVPDDLDNCLLIDNEDQRDTDGDGFGNACDADLNNDGVINVVDLGLLRSVFFTNDPNADLNGDGVVNVVDLGILRAQFFGEPGPGAQVPPQPPTCGAPDTGLDPAEAYGDVMFLRGNVAGDWAAIDGFNDFTNVGGDEYLLEINLGAGTFDYKVANEGWSIERTNLDDTLTDGSTLTLFDNGAGSPNAEINVPQSGCYSFVLDASDIGTPTLSMDRKF